MNIFRRTEAPPPPGDKDVVEPSPLLPPSRLQGTEPMYGYVVGLEILAVAVITAFARHGVGAPKSYTGTDNILIVVSIGAAIAYLVLLRVRNRTLAAFGAIIAAYIPSLIPGPTWVRDISEIGLIPPLVYAVVVAQRMRKATKLAMAEEKASGRTSGRPSGRAAARERPAARTRTKKGPPVPAGPQRSARYTPPKPKRAPARKAPEDAPSRHQRRAQKSE